MSEELSLADTGERFCRGCHHARPDTTWMEEKLGMASRRAWRLARCMHPAARHPDYATSISRPDLDRFVTGRQEPPRLAKPAEHYLCWTERGDEREGHCGGAGRLWEPRRRR
jgi:hypothetical protein